MMTFTLCSFPTPLGNVAIMQQPSCNHEDVITFELQQRKTAAWIFDGIVVPPTSPSFHLESSLLCEKNKSLFDLVTVVSFLFHGI